MEEIKKFVEFKLKMSVDLLASIEKNNNSMNDYAEGSRQGYIEALELEIQTLEQILEKTKSL